MDRTIPASGNEEIELYIRTYYSLLRSTGEVQVRSLEETHSAMSASLHQKGTEAALDLGAFAYAAWRLPTCITHVRLVLLGQSAELFARRGYPNLQSWEAVKARARRRKAFFDNRETLAVFINSISDIDDLIPMLTTYQIEWNKMHRLLSHSRVCQALDAPEAAFQAALGFTDEDFDKLRQVWGKELQPSLHHIACTEKRFALRLLAGSRTDYRRATQDWWRSVVSESPVPDIDNRPVYFISSNMHALPNLLSTYARRIEGELIDYLHHHNPENLAETYNRLIAEQGDQAVDNMLYYVMRKYFRTQAGAHHYERRLAHEVNLGIYNVRRPRNLDVGVQIIDLAKLVPTYFDHRVKLPHANWGKLHRSNALIINVDYPLGMAAYQVLSELSANVGELRGVYILGKAATLNGRVGDVMVPGVVYDEHSQNTYLFKNCFTAEQVAPFLKFGTVLDNQKAVTVRGTFLQNEKFMHVFYKEGYTDLEMEAGPYLSAMYENIYPRRYPVNEIVNLFLNQPYDIGILHYASDTPYSKSQLLLSKSLLYFGMDATYATAIAIMRRIFEQELAI